MNNGNLSIKTILAQGKHRPWPMPARAWSFYQEWNKVVFMHWKLPLEVLMPFVPSELEIDMFDGNPWASVVLFDMNNIRPKNLPPLSVVSDFHEVNVRTYVKKDGKAGVYFLSIEGSKAISCFLARTISGLPYRPAMMDRTDRSFHLESQSQKNLIDIHYETGHEVCEKTLLDLWLTERYALFQDVENKIKSFDIHHVEWPIETISIGKLEIKYPQFPFTNNPPDLLHYSPGVAVLAW